MEENKWHNIVVIGHLGKDPEVKYTASKKAVANTSVAVYSGKDNPTMWFRLEAWEEVAIDFEVNCKKGDKVEITGRLGYESWEKDGETKSAYKIVVNSFKLLKAKPTKSEADAAKEGEKPEDDESLPF